MNLEGLKESNDAFIGEALLAIMGFFMYVWLTSSASPINFPNRASVALLVGHLEVLLIIVIPIALLGLVQSMSGTPVRSGFTNRIESATAQVKARSHAKFNRDNGRTRLNDFDKEE
jgi:hypothetical protein